MFGYIYVTTNLIDGTKYYGQHHGDFNPRYFGKGRKLTPVIKAIGTNSFKVEMVGEAKNQDELDDMERSAIRSARANGEPIYNLCSGGMFGNPYYNKGKKFSDEHKRKISEAQIGKVVSESARSAMSMAAKKRGTAHLQTPSVKAKRNKTLRETKFNWSDASRMKQRAAAIARWNDPMWREKVMAAIRRRDEAARLFKIAKAV